MARAHGRHAVVEKFEYGRALAFIAAIVIVNNVKLFERVIGEYHAVRTIFKRGFRDAMYQVRIMLMHKIQQVGKRLRGVFVGCKFQKVGFCCKEAGNDFALVYLFFGLLYSGVGRGVHAVR